MVTALFPNHIAGRYCHVPKEFCSPADQDLLRSRGYSLDEKEGACFRELADLLEALTIIRHPTITASLEPYRRYVSNFVNPQLSLPPTKAVWDESSRP